MKQKQTAYDKYKWISQTYKPFNYQVNYREIEEDVPLKERTLLRARYTLEDTRNFAVDILCWNEEAILYKTADFLRRKIRRLKARIYICEQGIVALNRAIKDGIHHTIHGLKDFGRDSSWLVKRKVFTKKYTVTSYKNDSKTRVVKTDVLKMIPFSAFIFIPGGEILLPAYLKLFPNSLPSQFVSDADRKQKFHALHII